MYIKIYTLSIPRPCSVSVQQKQFYQHFLFFASTLCGKQSSNINISSSFTQIQKLLRFYGFCSPLNSTTAFQLYTLQHMQNTKKASNAGSVAGVCHIDDNCVRASQSRLSFQLQYPLFMHPCTHADTRVKASQSSSIKPYHVIPDHYWL